MDTNFKEWMIQKKEELPPEDKKHFLRTLKEGPDKVLHAIAGSLKNSIMIYNREANKSLSSYDLDNNSEELLLAFQEHFNDELAK